MKAGIIALILVLVVVLIFGGTLVSSRNQLVAERESINSAFSQIDNQLQRRNDLIPNLVETVKGFAAQEKSVIDSVTSARAAMLGARTPAEKIAADATLESALGRLLVLSENYPNLKSNENFLRLQDELAGTENRIAVERRKYNEAVQRYNTDIALFPKNVAAGLFGFQREDAYFRAEPGAKEVPKVKF
ncbi:MAG: LemA family protein [Bryobacterales bacterium]|nr:LemA family protein [Bryobacterales bacterium]MBV9397115.1 LemA family protein [Bryobacterales bacterium]